MNGAEELVRLREIFAQSPSFSALLHGPDHRFVLANAAYQQLVGRPVIGRTVREAFPEVESQGILALLDEVLSTGKPFIGRDVEIVFQPPLGGPAKYGFWISFISPSRT
jgi:PAS domain-containing protein